MRGIIIAAGLGSRMGHFTESRPKCLLPIRGRTLLDRTVMNLRAAGCAEVVVVTGHKAETITQSDIIIVQNDDYQNNNILHSLMYAREYLDEPAIIMYSDIWVEPRIYRSLLSTGGDIILSVDRDWKPYYEGRSQHPVSEAENVLVDRSGFIVTAGKHLAGNDSADHLLGEFLGLWRLSAVGCDIFRRTFEELENRLNPLEPFEQAREWRKAYITDFVQYLVDKNINVNCSLIERGWAELDTNEDYQRLASIAERQKLLTISEAGEER